MQKIILRGTIIVVIIPVPSLVTAILVRILFNDLVLGIILGVVVHFSAMGFPLNF